MRALVTGGVSAELEAQFAEGREIRGVQETPEIAVFRRRAKLTQVPLYEGPMKEFGVRTDLNFSSLDSSINSAPVPSSINSVSNVS